MENEPHPWGVFLNARVKVIKWMREKGMSDDDIRFSLSMEEGQVQAIRKACNIE